MSFSIHEMGSLVPESYSRKLDERVLLQEMPYGYDSNPPPYWHQNNEAEEAFNAQKSDYKPYKK